MPRRLILRLIPAIAFTPLSAFAAPESSPEAQFAAIERGIGGRLGVAALDTATGRKLSYRASELFAMCSTFKLLLAGCILQKVDAGTETLRRPISYGQKDLLEYAPVTRAHVQQGAMTVAELCAAAVGVSDNTAANLLLAQIGGPAGLTHFVRSLGNQVTRLDRIEPDLNSALPGDPRDTTSPAAMVDSMQKLLTGDVLSARSKTQLAAWLEESTTGSKRLRAGVPADWRAGDKTGTGERGAIGDVGIFWPPNRKPILVAAYVMEGNATSDQREEAIAAVGHLVAQVL
ncbi:MAG TPA: class A beta-lactamase [Terracidiphilus sp.]